MKKIVIVSLLSFLSFASFATDKKDKTEKSLVSFTGQVVNFSDAEPLVGVKINIVELGKTIYTDIDGQFSLSQFPAGEYSLEIQYPSYSTKTVKAVVLKKKSDVNIRLFPS
tara:strand:- start:82 stop:414 length:333 start_codon:yes stop_codon:yes gene_type:complete